MKESAPVNATSISELLTRLSVYPISTQLVRIDGQRWAFVPGAATALAEEIALPHRIRLDEHTGLILRGWGALTVVQQQEIGQLIAAAR